ncbi:hypothetical protein H2200_004081 [Cladophialophora chaetospira]|uniref:BTB domain-containing protein n=1 Tax=Cladophialophora chaetospira TaxID=386627 RepID=A0AA39CKK0_9EURO|nr:hypothetical protein H2200_004081 [Cladophialophora chaetospira]
MTYPSWLLDAQKSIDFTDLTIRCESAEFRVHRVVDSPTVKIELSGEEPQIIERLLEYCYSAKYANLSGNQFLGHAKMYVAATKYGLPKLATAALDKYRTIGGDHWNGADFLQSISYIYRSPPESDPAMRRLAGFLASSHMRKLTAVQTQYDALRRTCIDVPDFAFDLLLTATRRVPLGICQCCKRRATQAGGGQVRCECGKMNMKLDEEWIAVNPNGAKP